MSRRAVVGALVGLPVSLSAVGALAGGDFKTELRFDLNADGTELNVVESPTSGMKLGYPKSWTLRLASFGPQVKLRTTPVWDDRECRIELSNVSYGRDTGSVVSFIFNRLASDGQWGLQFETDLWRSEDGSNVRNAFKSEQLPFAAFADGAVLKLLQAIRKARIDNTLINIFDGHIKATGLCNVHFNRDHQWTVVPLKNSRVSALAGVVTFEGGFVFGWEEAAEPAKAADGVSLKPKRPAPASVKGIGQVAAASHITFSGAGTPTLTLAMGASVGFEVTAFPERHSKARVKLAGTGWQTTLMAGQSIGCGTFVSSQGELSAELESPAKLDGKDPSLGAVKMRFKGMLRDEPFTVTSPVGRLKLRAVESTELQRIAYSDGLALPVDFNARRTVSKTAQHQLVDISISTALVESDLALPGSHYSRFVFDNAALRLFWEPNPLPVLPESYIWLGSDPPEGRRARLNLTRAAIRAARDHDLLSLTFRFSNLALVFSPEPRIEPKSDACRVVARGVPIEFDTNLQPKPEAEVVVQTPPAEGEADVAGDSGDQQAADPTRVTTQPLPAMTARDERPILVVEFPPQHVMEEALFRPGLPPLPQLEGTSGGTEGDPLDARQLIAGIAALPVVDRRSKRLAWRDAREAEPSDQKRKDFFTFSRSYEQQAGYLPADQQIYVGPFGLDADGLALARRVQGSDNAKWLDSVVDAMFAEAAEQRRRILERIAKEETNIEATEASGTIKFALQVERKVEAALPTYQIFRRFYAELRTSAYFKQSGEPIGSLPETLEPDSMEYFMPESRTEIESWPSLGTDNPTILTGLSARDGDARSLFATKMTGAERVPPVAAARLSEKSRLAFRVNCTKESTDHGDKAPPPTALKSFIEFSLDGLTDWATHDLAVVRRAERLFDADVTGGFGSSDQRRLNLNDNDMLAFQGFKSSAYRTAAEWLATLQATLMEPGDLDTAIEIPARVVMSPAQDAIWRTPRKFDAAIYSSADPADEAGTRLWFTTLDVGARDPGLRVIHSPDMRRGFIWQRQQRADSKALFPNGSKRLPGNGAPPRGPVAPWLLGPDDTGIPSPEAVDVFRAAKFGTAGIDANIDAVAFCEELAKVDGRHVNGFDLGKMIAWLCARADDRRNFRDQNEFRTSLDAYDRHELTLLSSAYGLPVMGRRELSGILAKNSSQFETDPGFEIADVEPGSAYYRPRELNVHELTLTALGGSFRHDTNFVPPASARHITGDNLFDAFSIERWRHWVVLGRDVFAEVIYKGFLYPIGHQASLVKVTERTFIEDERGKVRAYLRQRMYIRCGKPQKRYPAILQPNLGRQFPVDELTILTVTTPDIVDPSSAGGLTPDPNLPVTQHPSGRLMFRTAPGLAFWPRTALTDAANITFEMRIDGVLTKMPLIFLDNVAANDREALSELQAYYNALPKPEQAHDSYRPGLLRTLDLRGQPMRYCSETKVGEVSYATDYWTLKVEGTQSSPPGANGPPWAGVNDRFLFDTVLQGADQPPFYPAMLHAKVRIKQAERFSGQGQSAALAQFDGYFIANGLPTTSDPGNPLEVVLNLVAPVPMGMGNNGDRGGAMFRPELGLVALSRRKGPLGGRRGSESSPDFELGSLAHFYRDGAHGDDPKTPPPPVPPTNATTPAVSANVMERYFKLDTKLLGAVSLTDLVKMLGLSDPDKDLPDLKELVEFGASAGAAAEQGAEAGAQVVRDNVLLPLLDVVKGLRRQWAELQAKVDDAQSSLPQSVQFSLQQLYPEIDTGLAELEQALGTANETENVIAFALALSQVYQTGRNFLGALDRVAANPVARVEAAVRQRVEQGVGEITGQITNLVSRLDAELKAIGEHLSERLAAVVVGGVTDLATWLPVPLPDLDEILKNTVPADVSIQNTAIDAANSALLLTRDQVTAAVNACIPSIIENKPRDAAKVLVRELIKAAKQNHAAALVAFAQQGGEGALQDGLEDHARLLDLIDPTAPHDADQVLQALFSDAVEARVNHIAGIIAIVLRTRDAIGSGNVREAAGSVLELAELGLGPDRVGAIETEVRRLNNNVLAGAGDLMAELRKALLSTKLSTVTDTAFCDARPEDRPGLLDLPEANAKWGGAEGSVCRQLFDLAQKLQEAIRQIEAAQTRLGEVPDADNRDKLRAFLEKFLASLVKFRDDVITAQCAVVADAQTFTEAAGVLPLEPSNVPAILSALEALDFGKLLESKRRIGLSLLVAGKSFGDFLSENREVLILAAAAAAVKFVFIDRRVLLGTLTYVDLPTEQEASDKLTRLQGDIVKLIAPVAGSIAGFIGSGGSGLIAGVAAKADTLAQIVKPHLNGLLATRLEEFAVAVRSITPELREFRALGAFLKSFSTEGRKEPFKELMMETAPGDGNLAAWITGGTPQETRLGEFEKKLTEVDVRFQAVVVAARTVPTAAAESGLKQVDENFVVVAKVLRDVYAKLIEARAAVIRNLSSGVPDVIAKKLVAKLLVIPDEGAPPDELGETNDRLAVETSRLSAIVAAGNPLSDEANRTFLLTFVDRWAKEASTPLIISNNVTNLVAELLRGDLFKFIDVGAIRDQIEDYLLSLIPVRASLEFGFGGAFKDDGGKGLAGGIFLPQKGCELRMSSRVSVNFRDGKVEALAKGTIGPFHIKLVGDFIDAVTLKFRGASFTTQGGEKLKFNIDYEDFAIGRDLEFVQQLQAFLSPKEGSGFYLVPLRGQPGVEAGYGLNLGTISLATISFFNVSLNAAAVLPFDDSDARFRGSLSRRDSPFTISAAPYGGSGYFAVEANAKGIVGFEASFEYGGAAAFAYGPLQGYGRLMAGVYIRHLKLPGQPSITEIQATFFAGGSASIWVFSFGASLYVRLGMLNGNMTGEAVFTFSFSIGFADFDYSVRVARTENKYSSGSGSDSGGTQGSLNRFDRIRVASLIAGDIVAENDRSKENLFGASMVNQTRCMGVDWSTYRSYFDDELTLDEELGA